MPLRQALENGLLQQWGLVQAVVWKAVCTGPALSFSAALLCALVGYPARLDWWHASKYKPVAAQTSVSVSLHLVFLFHEFSASQ